MAVDGTLDGTLGSMNLNDITKLAQEFKMADNIFGGGNDGNAGGFIMGALLGRLLFNNGNGVDGNQNSDRAAIESAVSSALAQNNQANNNSMILLKDIQDSSQEVISSITASTNSINNNINTSNQTLLVQQLQNQIANLQGQSDIKSAIAASTSSIINETHEQTQTVTNQLDTINTNMLVGFNNVTREISNDGEKTRALITQNMVTDLNNQIAELRTRQTVSDGNITVTQNVNQQQAQQQQQQQFAVLTNAVSALAGQINRSQQDIINLGTMVGNTQSSANTNVR